MLAFIGFSHGMADRSVDAALFQALREHGDLALVGDVMRSGFVTLQADQSLHDALTEVRAEGGLTMAVTEDGRFIGMLTPENVGEFFMIRGALANRPPAPTTPPMITAAPAAANAAVASPEVDKMILNYASAIREKAGSLNLTQRLPIIRGQ